MSVFRKAVENDIKKITRDYEYYQGIINLGFLPRRKLQIFSLMKLLKSGILHTK